MLVEILFYACIAILYHFYAKIVNKVLIIIIIIWSVFRGTLILCTSNDQKVAQLFGQDSREYLLLQWPWAGTVPTAVSCKMASIGTMGFYGFDVVQILLFVD